jgi:putative PIN family toxin of toxin-antitoxin system
MSGVRQIERTVVDLNLFVSGLISRLGQPRRLIDHLYRGSFQLIISQELRDELDEVLQREKFTIRFGLTPEDRTSFLALVDRRAIFVDPAPRVPVAVRDPKDEIVLATASGGSADYIVTGDVDLLVLKDDSRLSPLRIVTVRELLTILDAQE